MAPDLLVVDDSDFQRTMIRQAVEDEFHVVGEASNGVEAVEQYEKHRPDAITMDITMVGGLSLDLIFSVAATPSISGIMMSEMMRSGMVPSIRSRASSPFVAVYTS